MRQVAAGAALLAALVTSSCVHEPTGPGARRGRLLLAPRIEGAAVVAQFDRVRVTLTRPASTAAVVDTIAGIAAGATSVELTLAVPLAAAREDFLLYLRLISATGDTLFRNEPYPQRVTVTAGATAEPVPVTIRSTAVAAVLSLVAGDGQIATVGTLLAQPLVVQVTDQFGNGVTGEPVDWFVTVGGGDVSAATTVTDAGGFASTQWTMGSVAGASTAQAVSGKLAGSPLVFSATATPVGATATWLGGDPTAPADWSAAGNWSTGLVPGSGDNVFIPKSAANQPVLSASSPVGDLILETGASLTITSAATLVVGGNLEAGTSITGAGTVELAGTGSAQGTVPNVVVTGSVTAAGPLTVNGDLTVSGAGALSLGGQTVRVAGSFGTTGTGVLKMQNSRDVLDVKGDAVFAGGGTSGLLFQGVLRVAGNFTQLATGTPGSFEGASLHVTELNGATAQTVTFEDPTASHFGNLRIAQATGGTVVLATDVFGAGQLQTPLDGLPRVVSGVGRTMRFFGLDASNLTLDGTPLVVQDGSLVARFDTVTFSAKFELTAIQLTVDRPGGTFTFDLLQFLTTPSGGLFVSATDTAPLDGDRLTITVISPQAAIGPTFTVEKDALVQWQ